MAKQQEAQPRRRESHIFERETSDHYVEPEWVSERLFKTVVFSREAPVLDCCCGWGRILMSASDAGYDIIGSDIVDRSGGHFRVEKLDFLGLQKETIYDWWKSAGSIICNPPFDQIEDFSRRALSLMSHSKTLRKVAFICPLRRLPAAHGWLEDTPLRSMMFCSPRPSMPSGQFILDGGRVGGGTQDFAWLLWEKGYTGPRTFEWLHRDG